MPRRPAAALPAVPEKKEQEGLGEVECVDDKEEGDRIKTGRLCSCQRVRGGEEGVLFVPVGLG